MTFKLSKTSKTILATGIFVITLASVGAARAQTLSEQIRLQEELAVAQTRLSNFNLKELSSQRDELEEQLKQATLEFDDVEAKFSQPNGSIDVTDILFDIASECGVEITEVRTSGLTNGNFEGVPCTTLSLTLGVRGDSASLLRFVSRLNSDLTTGMVNSVEIGIASVDIEEEEEAGEGASGGSSADIRLVIYSYQGSSDQP